LPTVGTLNDAVISVQSADVTIENLEVVVNQPNAAVGISAVGSNATCGNLVLVNNNIITNGSGANAGISDVLAPSFMNSAMGVSIFGKNEMDCILVDLKGNTIGSLTNPFGSAALMLEKTGGIVGGPNGADSN